MSKVVYWMNVSLDGFIESRDGKIDWTRPDEELHRFFNEGARAAGAFLYGRRTYELMASFWPTADEAPSAPPEIVEFSRLWKSKPKVVFSTTLRDAAHGTTIVRDDLAGAVQRLKRTIDGDLGLGGAGIGASFMKLGLIDEYRLFVYPIVLGGGKPYFAELEHAIGLRLIETRSFSNGVVLLHYRRGN